MNRSRTILYTIIFLFVAPYGGFSSDWAQTVSITDKIIMLRFDDGYIIHYGYGERPENDFVYNIPLDFDRAMATENYSIYSPDDPDYLTPVTPDSIGRKTKGEDFSRNCPGNNPDNCPVVYKHYIFLHLPYPLKDQYTYYIELNDLAANYNTSTLEYNFRNTRSDAVKVNQRGYIPDAARKFAYISYWMGDSGPLNLDDYTGNRFYIIDFETGREVFQGTINKRLDFESGTGTQDLRQENDPKYFAMADVWECDFSSFSTPGIYVVAVEGMGTSYPFKLDQDIYREAYYHTTRALYHNRTGIPLEAQHTAWHRPRTLHPDDGVVSFEYTHSRWIDWGGSENGNRSEVLGLVDPGVNLKPRGWYMDAGDWDGYYSHTLVPRYLMMAYDLAPVKFADGELNIPESGNGIPDILDEAAWLIQYLDRTRGPSGGIAGARIHPDFRTGGSFIPSWEDSRTWLISGEDYVTTFTFAGLAAHLAWCYEKTGRPDLAVKWYEKATEAFYLADQDTALVNDDLFNARLYAAAALYKFTGSEGFQDRYIADYKRTTDSNPRNNREWANWLYLTADHANINLTQRAVTLSAVRTDVDVTILDPAERRSFRVGFNWWMPYVGGQPSTPAVFPALVLYYITGEQKYLTASQTSADYYLGGNPLNIVWVTGLGHHRPERVLHLDTWYHPDGREQYPPGIVPFGPNINRNWNSWLVFSGEFASDRVYPDNDLWPPHELFFNSRYAVPTNEYSVHQTIVRAAAVYGLLSGTADGSFSPNKAPVLSIVSPTDEDSFTPGEDITIEVDAYDEDGMVIRMEYFHGRHKIGESSTPPFSFTWENVPVESPDIMVVAHDNEGARTTRSLALVQNVTLNRDSLNMNVDDTFPLAATLMPRHANNQKITWSSSDTAIATVSGGGVVTALAPGDVQITAVVGFTGVSSVCEVRVDIPVPAESIRLSTTSLNMLLAEAYQLDAAVIPHNSIDRKIAWNSSDETIARVLDNGLVIALAPGNAQITAAVESAGVSSICYVAVMGMAESVQLSETSLNLIAKETFQLSATVLPENATDKDITWSTSDEAIATVSADGLVTAVAPGDAQITAAVESAGVSSVCDVTVSTPTLANIIPGERKLKIFPNPMDSKVLSIQVPGIESEEVIISIHDLAGRPLYANSKSLTGGVVKIEPGLSSGFYIIRVLTSGYRYIGSLSVINR
jgi:endoglucanase